jgi:phosphinothricin acetyltransferase
MDIAIDKMEDQNWPYVREIFQQGIATGDATFEKNVPEFSEWDKKHLRECRLILKFGGRIVGWAALSPVSRRSVYAGVAELSLYVAASERGKGFGKRLLSALIEESERCGIWTLQASIFPENEVSIALHKLCGFRIVGVRERIGQTDEIWRNTVLMERRSKVAGN